MQLNHIRTLQGIFIKSLMQYAANSHELTILCDIVSALQQKNDATDVISAAVENISELSNADLGEIEFPDQSAELVVGAASGHSVLLQAGGKLQTPFGAGTILTLYPKSRTVKISLPYGIVYSSIAEAIQWFSYANDHFGSPRGFSSFLIDRWERTTTGLHLSSEIEKDIINNKELYSEVIKATEWSKSKYDYENFGPLHSSLVYQQGVQNVQSAAENTEQEYVGPEINFSDDDEYETELGKEPDHEEMVYNYKDGWKTDGIISAVAKQEILRSLPFAFAPTGECSFVKSADFCDY